MPPNNPSIRPSVGPTLSNTPKEIEEALDASKKMDEAMKKIYDKMTDPVEYKGTVFVGKKMDIETPNGPITLYMQSPNGVWVSNGKEALLFQKEGDFFSLTHVTDHSQPYSSGGPELYRYDPYQKPIEIKGNAKEYIACVKTFLDLIKGI